MVTTWSSVLPKTVSESFALVEYKNDPPPVMKSPGSPLNDSDPVVTACALAAVTPNAVAVTTNATTAPARRTSPIINVSPSVGRVRFEHLGPLDRYARSGCFRPYGVLPENGRN